MTLESAADKVFREVTELTLGKNFATASYAALCSLEALAILLKGNFPPYYSIVEDESKSTKISVNDKGSILEIGSGFGTITRLLLILFNGPIVCFELDPDCIKKLEDLRSSLTLDDSKRLIITNSFDETHLLEYNKFELSRNNFSNFYGIVIDGPILGKELRKLIKNSPELRFVFIERYRLIQRAQVSFFLLRCGFQQQYLETRHNKRMTGAYFIVDVCTDSNFSKKSRALYDFMLTSLRLYPKLLKNLAQSRGRNFKVGKFKENSQGITHRIYKKTVQ